MLWRESLKRTVSSISKAHQRQYHTSEVGGPQAIAGGCLYPRWTLKSEWVDADKKQSGGQRKGSKCLSGRKSAEPRNKVTEKSTTWFGGGGQEVMAKEAGKKVEDLVRGGQKGRPREQLLDRGAERLGCSGPWSRARS